MPGQFLPLAMAPSSSKAVLARRVGTRPGRRRDCRHRARAGPNPPTPRCRRRRYDPGSSPAAHRTGARTVAAVKPPHPPDGPSALLQLLLPGFRARRQHVPNLQQLVRHPNPRSQRHQSGAQHIDRDRPHPFKPRMAPKPRRHRVRQNNGLRRIRRTLQLEQQRQQGVAPCQIILRKGAFVHYLIAHRWLPSPQR